MDDSAIEALGPPPFRFTPSQGASVQGPAFSPAFKLIASVLVLGIMAWFLHLWDTGKGLGIAAWCVAPLAVMVYTWWSMMRSVTRLDGQALQQTWVWHKKIELHDLAWSRLIRVPGLGWLVAPRIYLRSLSGKSAVFHAAQPQMLDELERLAVELKAFRRLS